MHHYEKPRRSSGTGLFSFSYNWLEECWKWEDKGRWRWAQESTFTKTHLQSLFLRFHLINLHTHTVGPSLIYVWINERKHINELMDSVSVCPGGMRAGKRSDRGEEKGENWRYEEKTKHQKCIKKARGQKEKRKWDENEWNGKRGAPLRFSQLHH